MILTLLILQVNVNCYFLDRKKNSDVKDTKTALVSFLVNSFVLIQNEGPTYPDMGQLTPTRTNLSRHGATYPDIGQLTQT